MSTSHRIRTSALSWQQVDDEVVVLDLDRSVYLALNGSAAVLWNKLAEGGDDGVGDDSLTAELVSAFGIDAERASTSVAGFLDRSRSLGLVE